MLRAKDYWLSQDDETLQELEDAYKGDTVAQGKVLSMGSFLFLTKEEAELWNTKKLRKVIDTGDAVVYATR